MTSWTEEQRQDRLHKAAGDDQRLGFERDRDRLLYSSAFHRLAGITQVVKAGEEEVFHTRQQHSYKVAQVGRRLAQKCKRENVELAAKIGLDEEVVEAACLAHDLGHPPFGHIGEACLDDLVTKNNNIEGFEGNAQSFRIVTKLGVRFSNVAGLDLTRATLAACLKYPWLRDTSDPTKKKKWSAYSSERKELEWARQFHPHEFRTAEAHLMDWADDIAYSVHDLEDFHRCRAIPWHEIRYDTQKQNLLISKALESWFGAPSEAKDKLRKAMDRLLEIFLGFENLLIAPYSGTREQRQSLRTLTSQLIGRYVNAATLHESETGVRISEPYEIEVRILKQITRDYVIGTPALAAQQHGYAKVISTLFSDIMSAVDHKNPEIPQFLPHRLRYLWELREKSAPRFAADCIASLTEREALALYARLTGASSGSVLDPIVR